jgi:hypothetical protein
MSAALQLPVVWGSIGSSLAWQKEERTGQKKPPVRSDGTPAKAPVAEPVTSLAFYRKHT